MSWLSHLFCGGVNSSLDECKRERDALLLKVSDLQSDLTWFESESQRLRGLCDEEITKRESAESDALRFYNELQRGMKIVDVSEHLGNKVKVDPWIMTPSQWRGVQPILISDLGYYAFPEEDWLSILTPIQAEVKRVLGFPKNEIKDCDNYSLSMCDAVSLAFMRAGLDKQGAFLKLLSTPHSYCGFMLPDYTIRVYEPMSGAIVGWLGNTGAGDYGEDTYKTQQAYFLS